MRMRELIASETVPQQYFVKLTLLFSLQGTNVVTFTVYWVFSAFYLFMDFTGRPKWVLQYKIQDGTNQPVSCIASHSVSDEKTKCTMPG